MRNIQLIIEYDGTNYCGWQIQKNGVTIQEEICRAIKQVTKQEANLIGSGRTDAGVHALAQSANFKTLSTIPTNKIPVALNSLLPKDIRITNAIEKSMEFHSRYSALGKIYQYRIINNEYGSALDWHRCLHVRHKLNVEKMKRGAELFIGTHDFTAFSRENTSVVNKVRTIFQSQIEVKGDELVFRIHGNGFLYNMVRVIVGTLIEVGQGRIEAESIPSIIASKDREKAGITAPAYGLYLSEVLY
ncbi:tRNA pseudouridine(38-40) synthase TruA [Alkalibaculum sp. M08DMB]|uniref:tRNA pseudouridine synthase A n=1 Tax=Alkalibaculum sporogenes TaxID=2655001 RepID=A0A6A7K791_9FIRM|nr:tRNA pseudouridine(38-40) synthase TruA [Alkalibaculum sporogenes]MPW24993.1 tRNA pseudouridine(38-40) synthase TruA [Alkalibaculum sporogenes]